MNIFDEPPQFADVNRERARKIRVCTAQLADGTLGCTIFYFGRFMVMTEQQALKLANQLVDRIEFNRKELTNAESE